MSEGIPEGQGNFLKILYNSEKKKVYIAMQMNLANRTWHKKKKARHKRVYIT